MADIASRFRRALSVVGIVIKGSADEADTTSPSITSGAGVPTATEPSGSFYIRNDGAVPTSLYRSAGSGTWAPVIPAYNLSAEITANGSAQSTAHTLGAVPSVVIAIPSDLTGGVFVVTYGTHTSTNSIATVTTGEKYRLLSIR